VIGELHARSERGRADFIEIIRHSPVVVQGPAPRGRDRRQHDKFAAQRMRRLREGFHPRAQRLEIGVDRRCGQAVAAKHPRNLRDIAPEESAAGKPEAGRDGRPSFMRGPSTEGIRAIEFDRLVTHGGNQAEGPLKIRLEQLRQGEQLKTERADELGVRRPAGPRGHPGKRQHGDGFDEGSAIHGESKTG
jgi:hypothetical protein